MDLNYEFRKDLINKLRNKIKISEINIGNEKDNLWKDFIDASYVIGNGNYLEHIKKQIKFIGLESLTHYFEAPKIVNIDPKIYYGG